jgi:hypothetical protein
MHRSVRRLTLGAAIAGIAAVAVPAAANAATTCTYDASRREATIFDDSKGALRIVRSGQFIAFGDGSSSSLGSCAGPTAFASVTNTDTIFVKGTSTRAVDDGFVIDQSNGVLGPGATPESDGNSEIEVKIQQQGPGASVPAHLTVVGTAGADTIAVDSNSYALGADSDLVDGNIFGLDNRAAATQIDVIGAAGNDFITGRGGFPGSFPPPAKIPLYLEGGAGNDTLVDGLGRDTLRGLSNDDTLFSVDGNADTVLGGTGVDVATREKFLDAANSIEQTNFGTVGILSVAKPVVHAKAGEVSRLSGLRWKHPQAWERLSKLEVRLSRAGDVVGSIVARPKSTRIRSHGAVKVVARGSGVSHQGKTVKLRLAVRLPKSLAGQALRMDIVGTDRAGRVQFEPSAGLVQVGT